MPTNAKFHAIRPADLSISLCCTLHGLRSANVRKAFVVSCEPLPWRPASSDWYTTHLRLCHFPSAGALDSPLRSGKPYGARYVRTPRMYWLVQFQWTRLHSINIVAEKRITLCGIQRNWKINKTSTSTCTLHTMYMFRLTLRIKPSQIWFEIN